MSLWPQGLGKTVEALFAFDRLRDQGLVGRALVFAPKNMVLEWVHDLERFLGAKYQATAIVGTAKPGRWQENAALLAAGALPRRELDAIRARWREKADPSWEGQV